MNGLFHWVRLEENMEGNQESKDEYLMLREEILHLDSIANNTINFFYAFISAYIAFALTQDDTIFILLSFMGIIPPYSIVLNKMDALCRTGAYLNVFHEGEVFNWERRYMSYRKKYESSKLRVISWNTPFSIASIAITILFLYRTKWECFSVVDIIKSVICIALLLWVLYKAFKNINKNPQDYIKRWENIN